MWATNYFWCFVPRSSRPNDKRYSATLEEENALLKLSSAAAWGASPQRPCSSPGPTNGFCGSRRLCQASPFIKDTPPSFWIEKKMQKQKTVPEAVGAECPLWWRGGRARQRASTCLQPTWPMRSRRMPASTGQLRRGWGWGYLSGDETLKLRGIRSPLSRFGDARSLNHLTTELLRAENC